MTKAGRLFTVCGCRNDPALAAAELALAIEKAALGTGAAFDNCQQLLQRQGGLLSQISSSSVNAVHNCRCN